MERSSLLRVVAEVAGMERFCATLGCSDDRLPSPGVASVAANSFYHVLLKFDFNFEEERR